MDDRFVELARKYQPLAARLLREAIRIPHDYVDRPVAEGGDPLCGLSNHEGPRLELLRKAILEMGAVDGPDDVAFDGFGNLRWIVQDPDDGIAPADKTVVYFDGHVDTVKALRPSWRERTGGLDPYLGLVDAAKLDKGFLARELGYLPPEDEWEHVIWGRGSADQLAGVVCQVVAAKVMRELRAEGALRGVIVHSYATVCEEDNDGAGPMYIMRKTLPGAPVEQVPDVVVLTEGTGCAHKGALGIYRGQRGRMQIEVAVTGKSCHGSMPWEGKNPLEWAGRILVEATEAHERGEGFLDDAFLGKGTRTASFATLETPSDCAVPERFTFRFDRRLTVGESPDQAVQDVDALPAVARARAAGLQVDVRVPTYDDPSWKGVPLHNPQIYAGWLTPEDHPAVRAALATYRGVCTPLCWGDDQRGRPRREPRLSRWIFSTDGVGFPLRADDDSVAVPESKGWVRSAAFKHPAMFGIGPGIEQNTHKIGEALDGRELAPCIAFYARFPGLYHASRERAAR